MKKINVIVITVMVSVALMTGCSTGKSNQVSKSNAEQSTISEESSESVNAVHYATAEELAKNGKYDEAIDEYKKAEGYSDSNEKIFSIYHTQGDKALTDEKFEEAIKYYKKASEYRDVSEEILGVYYVQADKAFEAGEFDKSILLFKNAGTYKDAATRISEIAYNCAQQALKDKNSKLAASYFSEAGNYKDAKEQAQKIYYSLGAAALKNKNYEEGAQALRSAGDYPAATKLLDTTLTNLISQKDYDKAEKVADCFESSKVAGLKSYIQGRKAYNDGDYANALVAFVKSKETKDSDLYIKASNYFLGIKALEDKDYKSAQSYFIKGENYKDSQALLNVSLGEYYIAQNNYETAVSFYSKVPKTLKVKDINIQARKTLMNRISSFKNIKGSYYAKSNLIKTTNVSRRNKKKYYGWHIDKPVNQQYLNLRYSVNKDGTINLTGTVSYYRYTNCSTLRDSLKHEIATVRINLRNLKSIPTNVTIASHVKLKYKKGIFTLEYSEKDNYSIYYYNVYKSTVSFKKG